MTTTKRTTSRTRNIEKRGYSDASVPRANRPRIRQHAPGKALAERVYVTTRTMTVEPDQKTTRNKRSMLTPPDRVPRETMDLLIGFRPQPSKSLAGLRRGSRK